MRSKREAPTGRRFPSSEGNGNRNGGSRGEPGRELSAKERERAALALIARYEPALRRTARRYSLCADDAEDAYQRAMEILLVKAPTADPGQLVRWMQTVTKHEAISVRSQRERLLGAPRPSRADGSDPGDPLDLLPSEGVGPGDRVQRREHVARSREALAALKPQEARALALKAQGYSYEEIGRFTGWSYTKINRCIAEGRRAFLKAYAGIEAGEWCGQMRPLIDRVVEGSASVAEVGQVRRHNETCGPCRIHLLTLRGCVLELGGAALAGGQAAGGLAGDRAGILERLSSGLTDAREAIGGLFGRLHGEAATQIAVSPKGGLGPAISKLAAVCGIGAIGAATCAATGVVGPGIRLADRPDPAPKVQHVADQALRSNVGGRVADTITGSSAESGAIRGGSSGSAGDRGSSGSGSAGSVRGGAPVSGSAISALEPSPAAPSPAPSSSGDSGGSGSGSVSSAFEPH